MNIIESLQVSLFGISIVFAALILLFLLLKIQSHFLNTIFASKKDTASINDRDSSNTVTKKTNEKEHDIGVSQGELKLIGLDEKTAALIMAIVSDENNIPLSKLNFKKIKALN